MPQKEVAKSTKKDALEQVPAKVGFLNSIHAEFLHVGYERVGSVTKGEIGASHGPITLGLGAGAEKLEYYDPLFFITPRVELRGIAGDVELYAVGSVPIVPGTKETKKSISGYVTLGGAWELSLPEVKEGRLRLGMEIEASGEGSGKEIRQGIALAGFGGSVEYAGKTVYVIENVVFAPEKPYSQHGMGVMTPHHHKVQVGAVVQLEGVDVGAEFFQTPFSVGGEVSFSIKTGYIVPKVYGWGSKGWGMIGDEVGVGVAVPFSARRLAAKATVERAFGTGGGDVMALDDMGGRHRIGEELPDNVSMKQLRFWSDAIEKSETLGEFADKYRGRSMGDILFAARGLGGQAKARYSDDLAKGWGNVFSKRSARVEGIDSEKVYGTVRNWWIEDKYEAGKNPDELGAAGICANISSLQTEFLRELGLEAYSLAIPSGKMQHVVSVVKDPESGNIYLLDYYDVYENKGGELWPLVREYANANGVVPHGMYVYGNGDELVGYYEAPEKKLNRAMASDKETLKDALLRSRPKKR
ncbi:MAG: hypothetical protein GY852_06090 [bacterium]|nr:hypothetical protein [bacterium]